MRRPGPFAIPAFFMRLPLPRARNDASKQPVPRSRADLSGAMTPAIPAATLILVRDVPGGEPGSLPEILMVERAATMAFAPGALVFPGGRLDAEDHELGEEIGVLHGAAIVAAVRETIEETAVPVALDPLPSPDVALDLQAALLAGEGFAAVLARHRLRIDPAALTLFARWVPELKLKRRFDTLFFLAQAPPGAWHPNVREMENRSAEWMSAAEVLRRDAEGEANVIFPTRCNLHRLAQHGSFAAMRDDAARHPVEPVTPWIEQHGDERLLTIPSHLGYPVTQEPIDTALRG